MKNVSWKRLPYKTTLSFSKKGQVLRKIVLDHVCPEHSLPRSSSVPRETKALKIGQVAYHDLQCYGTMIKIHTEETQMDNQSSTYRDVSMYINNWSCHPWTVTRNKQSQGYKWSKFFSFLTVFYISGYSFD